MGWRTGLALVPDYMHLGSGREIRTEVSTAKGTHPCAVVGPPSTGSPQTRSNGVCAGKWHERHVARAFDTLVPPPRLAMETPRPSVGGAVE